MICPTRKALSGKALADVADVADEIRMLKLRLFVAGEGMRGMPYILNTEGAPWVRSGIEFER